MAYTFNKIPPVIYTASATEGWKSKVLTANRDQATRLEELANSQERLSALGLVSCSDEVASARRRFQF